ncbi:hypothetical protein ACWGCW_38400 [Streptomyces sp. NPDC054933]
MTRRSLELTGLRLLGRAAKDIEILEPRHQLALAQRQFGRSKPVPADRVLLAALSRLLPRQSWGSFCVTAGAGEPSTQVEASIVDHRLCAVL